jgi:hypothetical protein
MFNDVKDSHTAVVPEDHSHTTAFVAIFGVLALLVVGEIISLSKVSSLNSSFQTEQTQLAQTRKDLSDQLASKVAEIESSDAQQLEALRTELDKTAKGMGSTGRQLNNAKALVATLQQKTAQQAEELKQEISKKADEEKVGALSQDLSGTKTDLSSTKQNVDTLTKDLGMARSELGTLIARNHNDIDALRMMGERDYYEFTLNKGQKQDVAGVGLILKKTNVKRSRFDLTLLADDMAIDKKSKTVNEPVAFYLVGSKRPYEVVVNRVVSNQVTGYISTPKGAVNPRVASSRPAEGEQH